MGWEWIDLGPLSFNTGLLCIAQQIFKVFSVFSRAPSGQWLFIKYCRIEKLVLLSWFLKNELNIVFIQQFYSFFKQIGQKFELLNETHLETYILFHRWNTSREFVLGRKRR